MENEHNNDSRSTNQSNVGAPCDTLRQSWVFTGAFGRASCEGPRLPARDFTVAKAGRPSSWGSLRERDQQMNLRTPTKLANRMLDAILLLSVQGIMTDGERRKAKDRLDKWAKEHGLKVGK